MAQSQEYPDLRWIPPRAYGNGRDGKAVRYIVIHYTAGSEGPTSAEDGALYNQRRTDGTSAHYFVDRNTIIHGVLTKNRANCARHRGNRLGIQYELCGTVQTRAEWLDAPSLATLKLAAKQVARDCRKYKIPVRRLTVAETRRAWTEFPNGPRGIVGHVDCTLAYPEDGGDHTDPGKNFPWDVFLGFVRAEMEEDDMPGADEVAKAVAGKLNADLLDPKSGLYTSVAAAAARGVWAKKVQLPATKNFPDGREVDAEVVLEWLGAAEEDTRAQVLEAIAELGDKIDALNPPDVPPTGQ
jgi:hypothetical protein